ncbi:hypothetical protein ANN_08427 [Periplaneta americana]|uniref:Reverse transcriptase domain-containing protein n=1 Tax=Periplaneta americana TaxID=6978 RepID=A0ABQ8T222_PERAM|nr:hypothetical protein ANN_08427 [Periplaneta americana]
MAKYALLNIHRLERVFDSVSRHVIWQTLKEYGIPPKIINIIKDMYQGSKAQIIHEGNLSESIQTRSGVRQGCILSLTLLLMVLERTMRRVIRKRKRGIQWDINNRLEDLDFADDICLLPQRFRDMEAKVEKLQEEVGNVGLKINSSKTKQMRVNCDHKNKLTVNDIEIEEVDTFLYLGSVVQKQVVRKKM